MKITCSIAIALSALLPITSQASLITKDFLNVGDGLITYDSATNKQWLDLGVFSGYSFTQVNNALSSLAAYQGFQYANAGQISRLFLDGGIYNEQIAGTPSLTYGGNGEVTQHKIDVINMLGSRTTTFLNPNSFDIDADGFFAGSDGNVGYADLKYVHQADSTGNLGTFEVHLGIVDQNNFGIGVNDPHRGNWIVRSVPEPTPLALLGAGIFGMVLLRMRERIANR